MNPKPNREDLLLEAIHNQLALDKADRKVRKLRTRQYELSETLDGMGALPALVSTNKGFYSVDQSAHLLGVLVVRKAKIIIAEPS
jgi:hypothetical protein